MSTLPGEGGRKNAGTPRKSVAVRTFRIRFTEFHRNPFALRSRPFFRASAPPAAEKFILIRRRSSPVFRNCPLFGECSRGRTFGAYNGWRARNAADFIGLEARCRSFGSCRGEKSEY